MEYKVVIPYPSLSNLIRKLYSLDNCPLGAISIDNKLMPRPVKKGFKIFEHVYHP